MSDLIEMRLTGNVAMALLIPSKFDDSNAEDIGRELSCLVEGGSNPNLDLDLGNVQSVGSMGLAKLVALHRKVKAAGGQLRLFNVDGVVYETFQVTKLNTLLDIRPKAAG